MWVLSSFAASAMAAGPEDPPPSCFVANLNDDLPTCTSSDGKNWAVNYPARMQQQQATAFIVLALLIGIAVTVAIVVFMRRQARNAGLDPNTATAVTLLTNPGVSAIYLASNLQPNRVETAPEEDPQQAAPADKDHPSMSVADRLDLLGAATGIRSDIGQRIPDPTCSHP